MRLPRRLVITKQLDTLDGPMIPRACRKAFQSGLAVLLVWLGPGGQARAAQADESADVAALAAAAKKSVVVIRHYGRDGKEDGIGAGFVVSGGGLIATCLHVVGEARPITVELTDGRRFDAEEVYASDRKLDLAVVRIRATNLPALRLGDASSLKQGQSVIAMGNPAGLEHSVVQGVVSAKRDFNGIEMIQLAIPIEPGNSGGPLLDFRGRVQGLLNMKSAVTANLGFAVPVNALQTLLDRPNPVAMERWLKLGALDPATWQPLMGARWHRKADRIQVEDAGAGFGGRALCLWGKDPPPLPYEVSVMVKLEDESGAAGLVFAADGGDKHYGFYPTAGRLRLTRFDGPDVFSWTILKELNSPHYHPGQWNAIAVRLETNRIAGYVNGELVIESTEPRRQGKVGLAKFRDTKAQFKNFYVGTNRPPAQARGVSRELTTALADSAGKSDEEIIAHLKAAGESAPVALLERARQLDRESQQLRRMASGLGEHFAQRALAGTLEKPEEKIDLFHAALLVASLDNPELDVDAYRAEMSRLGDELRGQVADGQSDTGKLATLTKFLFSDHGFHGSRTDFYNRANSYVNEVLDDREGLPITLAVVYLELARQIGLTNVTGIPVPTRFMVRFQPGAGQEQIIDVFDGGKVLTRSEAVELVADNVDAIREKDFQPATKREIITRMLRNLLGIAQRDREGRDALRYLNAIVALNGDSAMDRLNRVSVQLQQGNQAAAREDLRWLLEHEPAGIDLDRVRELYRSL